MSSRSSSYIREQRSFSIAVVAAVAVFAVVWTICLLALGFWYGLVAGWIPALALALGMFYLAQIPWGLAGLGALSAISFLILYAAAD